jgi:hypothetical protein
MAEVVVAAVQTYFQDRRVVIHKQLACPTGKGGETPIRLFRVRRRTGNLLQTEKITVNDPIRLFSNEIENNFLPLWH